MNDGPRTLKAADMFSTFTSVETLTPAQCEDVCSAVHMLRSFWTQVHESTLFFTLGVASYIEFCRPGDAAARYREKALQFNPLLSEYFSGMMENLRSTLQRQLGEPVAFAEGLARPGFHIWLTEAIPTQPTASVHFDLQYQGHGWPAYGEADYERPISFTLPVRLPAGGGGMNIWNLNYREVEELSASGVPVDIHELREGREHEHYAYGLGRLVLHSGHFLHQIAPVEQVVPGDERITLQGHALRCGGRWLLYW
jgi:hypothetical protein